MMNEQMKELMHQMMLTSYKEKAILISELGEAMSRCRDLNVSRAWYEAWYNKEKDYAQEWLVLEHTSGAIKVRNVNINSNSINIKELGMLVSEGYYAEVKAYREFMKEAVNEPEVWERIA